MIGGSDQNVREIASCQPFSTWKFQEVGKVSNHEEERLTTMRGEAFLLRLPRREENAAGAMTHRFFP
eukprot:scaffold4396_cov204-Amphora_coffeaeformis.AAC.5